MVMDLHQRNLGYISGSLKHGDYLPSSLDKLKAVNQEIEYLDDVLQHYDFDQIPSLKCIKTALTSPDIWLRKLGDSCSFRMPDFTQKKRSKSKWFTTPFFVKGGYKMNVCVYANGFQSGIDSHISVSLLLYCGEQLQWPISLPPNIGIRVELMQDNPDLDDDDRIDKVGPELTWIPTENTERPKLMKKTTSSKNFRRASSLPPWCLPPPNYNQEDATPVNTNPTNSKPDEVEEAGATLIISEKFAPLNVISEHYAETYNSLVFQVVLCLV